MRYYHRAKHHPLDNAPGVARVSCSRKQTATMRWPSVVRRCHAKVRAIARRPRVGAPRVGVYRRLPLGAATHRSESTVRDPTAGGWRREVVARGGGGGAKGTNFPASESRVTGARRSPCSCHQHHLDEDLASSIVQPVQAGRSSERPERHDAWHRRVASGAGAGVDARGMDGVSNIAIRTTRGDA